VTPRKDGFPRKITAWPVRKESWRMALWEWQHGQRPAIRARQHL